MTVMCINHHAAMTLLDRRDCRSDLGVRDPRDAIRKGEPRLHRLCISVQRRGWAFRRIAMVDGALLLASDHGRKDACNGMPQSTPASIAQSAMVSKHWLWHYSLPFSWCAMPHPRRCRSHPPIALPWYEGSCPLSGICRPRIQPLCLCNRCRISAKVIRHGLRATRCMRSLHEKASFSTVQLGTDHAYQYTLHIASASAASFGGAASPCMASPSSGPLTGHAGH